MNHGRALIALALCLACCAVALAEPTPTISYLMSEPASMLDLGIYKLHLHLGRGAAVRSEDGILSVRYDWELNRIAIEIWPTGHFDDSPEQMKAWCTATVARIRGMLAVNPETGLPVAHDVHSTLGLLFQHADYQSGREPTDLLGELEAITEIRFIKSWLPLAMYCSAPLMSSEIYMGEAE